MNKSFIQQVLDNDDSYNKMEAQWVKDHRACEVKNQ